jgi:uncharacterized RDD family membrane protein YckC
MDNFWGQRFLALLVDIIILTLFMYVVSAIVFLLFAQLGIFYALNYWIIIGAIIIIVYFTFMEGMTSSTLGKKLFKLKVKAVNGNMSYIKAFIRNLSKIYYFPLVLDVILGFIFGDTNDRILDKISGTYVISENKNSEKKLK